MSNLIYEKNCGTKPSDFKVIATFLPLSSTPNDNFAWITFKFQTQDDVHELIECVNILNEKHCILKPNVDLPSKGKLWIVNFLSVIGRGYGEFSKTGMAYKQKESDFYCYDDYCIDSQMNITMNKYNKELIEFSVPVTGNIKEDFSLMVNNKSVQCENYNGNSLKCFLNSNELDDDIDSYQLYSKQCGGYYKTGIQFVWNNSQYILSTNCFFIYLMSISILL